MNTGHTPLGFCPRCGYPIDPGRCPECGTVVTADGLALDPPRLARRRKMRRIGALALSAIALGAGYAVYRSVDWVKAAPTWILLRSADRSARVDDELFSRYLRTELSAEQSQRMFARLQGQPMLELPARVPAGMTCRGWLRPGMRMPQAMIAAGWVIRQRDVRLLVDGQLMLEERTWGAFSGSGVGIGIDIPPLSAGPHTLTMSVCHDLTRGYGRAYGDETVPAVYTWPPVVVTGSCAAEDRPPEEFVTPRYDAELASTIASGLQIPSRHGWALLRAWSVPVDCSGLSAEMVGIVWMRPSGTRRFHAGGPYHWPRLVGTGREIELPRTAPFDDAAFVDIRLIPSARVAVEHGVAEYFAGIVAIDHVPVQQGDGPWDPARASEAGPLRILAPQAAATATQAADDRSAP